MTYLFISHDLSVMRFICDRIAVIHKGRIWWSCANCEEAVYAIRCIPTRGRCSPPCPMPDPRREKEKEIQIYDPSMHDYSGGQAEVGGA